MSYVVPAISAAEQAGLEARNEILRANQFRAQAIQSYIAAYEHFWNLRDTERTAEQRQAKLDALGDEAVNILTDSATYATALVTNYPGLLPDLYHGSPFALTYEATPGGGSVLLGDMAEAWVTELNPED